jgi:hypothetical protein
MRFTLKQTWLGLRNSTTRIPFRYGGACLTRCPQAVLEATIEVDGRAHRGYSGDCLPPGWFDKTPGVSFDRQIADMLEAIRRAREIFAAVASREVTLFRGWLDAFGEVQSQAARLGFTPLLAGFGLSLVERAIADALARAAGLSFAEAVRADLYGIEAGLVHAELAGLRPADWLPSQPRRWVWVRHTVGLGDPLTEADVAPGEQLDDGLPQTVEDYLRRTGLRYFKVKLGNQLDRDRERLTAFARLVERYRGSDYRLTLDGNEQYHTAEDFDGFVAMIEGTPELETLRANTLAIEQPLDRSIALDPRHTEGIAALGRWRPVIIDESDGAATSYREALDVGYRGVSSKNCKGAIKALLNAGLTWLRNDRGRESRLVMTGEDLCGVGVVPVQADLCLAATLGLEHVERNGHHYHPGLSYLPEARREAALQAHPDFYARHGRIIGPRVRDGRFEIGSLQCVGFGFAALPELGDWQAPEDWSFASLGLDQPAPLPER